jgi:PilZ domain
VSETAKIRERRRNPRENRKLQVRFGPGDMAHTGTTRDFSERGLCLQAGTTYPPNTILIMKVDYPDGAATFRGVVRWSRDAPVASRHRPGGSPLPASLRKSAQGGMGIEFLESLRGAAEPEPARPAEPPRPAPTPPVRPRRGVPPEVTERDLEKAPTRRRQISTMAGNTFEVYEAEHRGALYVRIVQLPLTDGSQGAAFQEAFWTREEADAAVKAFLKSR